MNPLVNLFQRLLSFKSTTNVFTAVFVSRLVMPARVKKLLASVSKKNPVSVPIRTDAMMFDSPGPKLSSSNRSSCPCNSESGGVTSVPLVSQVQLIGQLKVGEYTPARMTNILL